MDIVVTEIAPIHLTFHQVPLRDLDRLTFFVSNSGYLHFTKTYSTNIRSTTLNAIGLAKACSNKKHFYIYHKFAN
jgi:hypothetical protein